jgi:hypothetical protein
LSGRRFAVGAVIALSIVLAPAAHAYLKLGSDISGKSVSVRWVKMPIKYFVTNRDVPGVTALQLQTTVQRGLDTWAKTPTVTISSQFGGFVGAEPFGTDGINVIGFRARPDLDRVLGATNFQIDDVTGELLESDIFLNSTFDWSVAAAGEVGRYDVQSIATHELGHFLGFGHSGLGETEIRPTGGRQVIAKRAIMFPIAFPPGNIEDRTPKPDDLAGLGDIYASTTFNRDYGQATGRVTLNGRGVFGAHVVAFNSKTGDLIAGFTLDTQGKFVIGGLKPGLYLLRAEPLDDADITSFFSGAVTVDLNFVPTYFTRTVAVPAGGSSTSVEIKVQPK